jgi:hypothetical protein
MKVLITDNVNKTKTKIKLKLLKKVINKLALYQNNKNGGIALILKKVKYTSSFARTQRSISYHNIFKAIEYRNLYFYSLIYILKDILDLTYYEHFLQYFLFLRILTKDLISNDEIEYSRYLISKYIQEFETLYGSN